MKARRPDQRTRDWIDARKRHRLSHAQVQMARELGFDPKGMRKLDNHKQEPWKLPLPQFIEECYRKRFGREAPEEVLSMEQWWRRKEEKKAARREAKKERRETGKGRLDLNLEVPLAPTENG